MIIKLLGADFSASNIGTVGNYTITYLGNIMNGTPLSIEKNELGTHAGRRLDATITIKSDYEYAGLTVMIGGVELPQENYTVELNENIVTLKVLAEYITNDMTISVETNYIGTGEDDNEYVEYTSLEGFERHMGFISQTGEWNNINDKYYHVVVPVGEDTSLTVTAAEDGPVLYYTGLRSYTPPTDTSGRPDYSEDTAWNKRLSISNSNTKTYATIPNDIKYLWFSVVYNSKESIPSNILIRTKKVKTE
jgi:hypothetical protein